MKSSLKEMKEVAALSGWNELFLVASTGGLQYRCTRTHMSDKDLRDIHHYRQKTDTTRDSDTQINARFHRRRALTLDRAPTANSVMCECRRKGTFALNLTKTKSKTDEYIIHATQVKKIKKQSTFTRCTLADRV